VLKVVLDTNVFISAMLHPNGLCGEIIRAWEHRAFVVLYNFELLEEIKLVCAYPRLKKRLKRNRIGALVNQLHSDGLYVRGNQNSRDSKDPKDNFLISIAELGKANTLVSSDNLGVLELGLVGEAIVLTPIEFLRFLRERQLID
jgi:uncharacterized protein